MEISTAEWTQHWWITPNGVKAILEGRSLTLIDDNGEIFAVVVPIDKYREEN